MKNVTSSRMTRIEWVDGETFEEVVYADDLALLSENGKDVQEKMTKPSRKAKRVELKVSVKNKSYEGKV